MRARPSILIALCLLGAIFFLQTPAIAAGIAGGASAGLADFANAASLGSSPAPSRGALSRPAVNRRAAAADRPARADVVRGLRRDAHHDDRPNRDVRPCARASDRASSSYAR